MPPSSVPDLYRSSPRFDNVRPKDIPVKEGKVKPGTGGLSIFRHPDRRWPSGQTWKLAGGSNPGSDLTARNDHGSHWLIEPSKEMSFGKYKAFLTALNATHVDDQKPEKFLNILPAQSDNQSRAIRFLYEALRAIVQEKVRIHDWDDNDYTYLSILALDLHLNTEKELSNFIYTPGEPFTKQQVLVAEATSAYIMMKDSEYGYGEDDDDDDDKSEWPNDRGYLVAILNPSSLNVHPIPIFNDEA